ncbi:hypothetical protein ACOSQ3_002990 [Xanthoceras sorbifolium]
MPVQPRWKAPSPGWYKVNSDAAVDSVRKRVGLGVVIRDCQGQVMAALSQVYPLLVSLEIAEAMAIRRGIQLVSELVLSPFGLESDASSVVSSILSLDHPLSNVVSLSLILLSLFLRFLFLALGLFRGLVMVLPIV